ncbi:hypothetical protein O0L34_g11975 [Tuta absoluta]|nr:hypothetical protein O0L34_g11975 [Tuta absoluta]
MLKAFEDLFNRTDEPQAKKLKSTTTPLISKILSKDVYVTSILNSLSCGAVDRDPEISDMVREGIAKMLHKDMGIRFTECFFITIYLPSTNDKAHNLSDCVHALLEMLLMDLRGQQRFKGLTLRDEPLELRSDTSSSKLLTMSRTYQGTFKRRTLLTSRHRKLIQADTNKCGSAIDVQISIASILDTFMHFAKDTPEASTALCLQLIKTIAPGLDLAPVVAKASAAILERGVNDLTPFVVDVCRVFIDELCKIDGIEAIVQKLHSSTKNTEGEHITRLLLQDVKLRCNGHEQFVLGSVDDSLDDVTMTTDESTDFSIEDLTSIFGKLSNWNQLTLQQKRRIRNIGLPPLWTDRVTFREQLDRYTPTTDWFGKMAAAYKQEQKRDVIKWLREMDKWPRKYFQMSAITEAIEWQERKESNPLPCDIHSTDCLAEWAARLMIRNAYQSSLPEPNVSIETSCTTHELQWCDRANQAGLGSIVLDCVKRNILNITYEKETLPWLKHKVSALRDIGLQTGDHEVLQKALATAEKYTQRFAKHTAPDVIVSMGELMLRLNTDLNTLSKDKLDEIYNIIKSSNEKSEDGKNKQNLCKVYEIGMTYYDDQWENHAVTESEQNAVLSQMLDILTRSTEQGLFDEGMFAIILNKLDEYKGSVLHDNVAKKLMELIQLYQPLLNDFSLALLSRRSSLLPSRSHVFNKDAEETVQKYKRCFQLVGDGGWLLLQYCSELRRALKNGDEDKYEAIFKKMKDKLFENPYAGSDYQLLNRYRNKLYEICEYDMSPSFKATADRVLKEIDRALNQRPPCGVLRLSQLCPELSGCQDCPGSLLGLKQNQTVVRIYEQVQVFLSSVRRPALFKVLLSDGTTRRYLHKSGEPLAVDAAALTVLRYTGQLWQNNCTLVGYNVTPLSGDCGLIEFLEEHHTLRRLIGGDDVLNPVLDNVQRDDTELMLHPAQANLAQYYQLCDRVPSHTLRDSIIRRSASEQDRIYKMNNFQSTLASTTIFTWILGLGDRHLENILYSIKDGRLCHVDWGQVMYFGRGEAPPARLTRNILSVIDPLVLEASLQQLLRVLQEWRAPLLALIHLCFKFMDDYTEKREYISSLLRGTTLTHLVIRDSIEKSQMQETIKTKHIQLLDTLFQDAPCKDRYSIEEQISCLLRACTAPQLLSHTRGGWEPWV